MKLTKAQRDQMVMVIFGTVAVGAALWYFVVNDRNQALAQTRGKEVQMRDKLGKADDLLRRAEMISDTLRAQSNKLWAIDSGLAPDRDAYLWLITNMNSYVTKWRAQASTETAPPGSLINTALPHEMNITSFSTPDVTDKGLIPHFPYRWAMFHVKGIAYFHDFGKFVADFENDHPYFRIQNLESGPKLRCERRAGEIEFQL